ncbi:MAG: multiheme c-type cytochrome [Planctomycetota bacterium]|jgi:hypothetical protein
MSAGRAIVLVLLLAAGGFLLWAAMSPVTTPPVNPPENGDIPTEPNPDRDPVIEGRFSHPSQCRECHQALYAEWESSMHAQAWTDPSVRDLSDDFEDTSCLPCHVPQPIHSAPVGSRVFARSTRHETGVDCLSCHLMPDGTVAAVRTVPDAPCQPVKVETFGEAVTCAGCHNQHELVKEWEQLFRNPNPTKGAILKEGRPETCNDCHMDSVDRDLGKGKTGKGKVHVFPGGHHLETLQKGVTFAASVKGDLIEAIATNSGTGHKAPADSRHRSFNVWVTVETEGGVRLHERTEIAEYRLYYRSPPRDSTNLRPGESQASTFRLPAATKGKAKVELVYALSPPKKKAREVLVVDSIELEFDTR